jgi:hypothetical protein
MTAKDASGFFIYPNPASKELFVSSTGSSTAIESIFIADLSGRVIASPVVTRGQNKQTINVANLLPGLYLLEINATDGTKHTTRLSIIH